LDRTILEAIKDPLTHIIRNSVDHGIEEPETRVRGGKKAEGLLYLRAYHESGQVNMEISDDGKGIDIDKVRARAIERGLITGSDGARLSDREIMQFIFHPGFSTAATVTNVSGRGVGMDVVKTNIERIGGTVDIMSERGKGTTLKIKIPLTLAIIPTLIVQSGAERFAVPQVSLVELVRLDGPRSLQKIEHIHGAPVYRLRGNLLPLVYLNDVLGLRGNTSREAVLKAAKEGQDLSINIVILQAYERQFGLVVDAIQDTAEIVAGLRKRFPQAGSSICSSSSIPISCKRRTPVLQLCGITFCPWDLSHCKRCQASATRACMICGSGTEAFPARPELGAFHESDSHCRDYPDLRSDG
jgi:two-component system chemotaxis sensor kinase CheA